MFTRLLLLAFPFLIALAAAPPRPAGQFAIGDLVELTNGMGLQVAEIAAGPDPSNYYFANLTGMGPRPFAASKLRLVERADAPPNVISTGDIVQFTSQFQTAERAVVLKSVGAFCQVKGNGIAGWVECKGARLLQRAARPAPPPPAQFNPGEPLQVRVGDFWMKGIAAKYDPATAWYVVAYEDGGQRYVGLASSAVLRKGPGLELPQSARAAAPEPAAPAAPAPAQPLNPPVCGGQPGCAEVNPFAATIIDFRVTPIGRDRLLTASVRFQNKNRQPLILGFVADAGVALDDQGNRYLVAGESSVRGIGLIVRNTIDPKFVLQPGESSDARFELLWRPPTGREVFGTSFTLDLALREIEPLPANQFRLGREHAIRFAGLGGAAQPVNTISQQPAPVPAPAAAPAPPPDACAGKPGCYSAGPFVAEVLSLSGSQAAPGAHHVLRLNVRFRNVTGQPIILAYKGGTSSATDNFGNPYYWGRAGTYDTSVQGIGIIGGRSIDPSFTLQPGESRSATFSLIRYNPPRNSILGTGFTYDVVIGQVELMTNGQQVRVAREYSLNFQNLASRSAPAAAPNAAPSAAPTAQSVSEAARKIGDLFRKK